MEALNGFINTLNGFLFHDFVVYALLATGLLFTIWSGFGQYRAVTHGVKVVRGKYDHHDPDEPGAISHFQALSAALSATVGLGNIGGVALAVALGGPGAVFWMWVIGVVGMALKMTEVTQSMLFRNTDDPQNPHGGPMFVVRDGFRRMGLGGLGAAIGGLFVLTLLISAVTGGNMFQAWNVADITETYFGVDTVTTGIILAVVVGAVIIGGIKRIGTVAGTIVPFMCIIYMLAAFFVVFSNVSEVPAMLALIVKAGLGLEEASMGGAFTGATVGFAAMWGIKRALFSSEAGQGSAPIAHSAARTDEPVREGVVAGLEPLIDTLVVCTLTALVILLSGAWNRGPETHLPEGIMLTNAHAVVLNGENGSTKTHEGLLLADAGGSFRMLVDEAEPIVSFTSADINAEKTAELGVVKGDDGTTTDHGVTENGIRRLTNHWIPNYSGDAAARTKTARETSGTWSATNDVFVLVDGGAVDEDTNQNRRRLLGTLRDASGEEEDERLVMAFSAVEITPEEGDPDPILVAEDGDPRPGVYGDYGGASLTAHAFDRVRPGLGKYLVTFAAWLFAISTMISWSYYGEQGIAYFGGKTTAILAYKMVFCGLIVVSCLGFIETDAQLDMWTTLGLGVMLVVNIPIMLIFGSMAMKAFHEYIRKLKAGEFDLPGK